MDIFCISEGKLYQACESPRQLSCARIEDYLKAVNDMKKRDEWKTTGRGAHFMQVEERFYDTESRFLRGLSSDGKSLLYSTYIDSVGGIYFKDASSGEERYIFANKDFDLCGINCRGGKCAVDIGEGSYERHIATLDTQTGDLEQLTEGFTSESHPFISRENSDNIYYTAMGYAQNEAGVVLEKSPCSICMYEGSTGKLKDIVADDAYDYLKPSDTADGDLYYIRRKYEPTRKDKNILIDIVLFPVRLIKAIFGFLSTFSMLFGGEPLRTGGRNPAKSRTADEREIFIEGNLIKAKRLSEKDDDTEMIPSEWVLIRRSKNGAEPVVKRSVMDYLLLDDGRVIYSDGGSVSILNADGKTERICRLKFADSICVID